MRAGAWNCRGLKSADSPTIPFLRWLVSTKALNFLFLSETKSKVADLDSTLSRLGFNSWSGHDASDLSGGFNFVLGLFYSSFCHVCVCQLCML